MLRCVACVLMGFGAAAVPRVADACSFPCGLSIERPTNGDAHPANAALQIVACDDLVETILSVTVDGVPASLGPAVPLPEPTDGRVSITPSPTPGQEVVIAQCGEEAPVGGCPDPPEPIELLRYIAGPDDVDAPPAGGTVTIAHTFGPSEVGCMDEGDVEFHVEVTGLDQGTETAVVYIVVLDTGPPEGNSAPRRTEWVGPDAVTSLAFDIGEHLDFMTIPPEDVCVTVAAMDLAGHVTAIAETCGSTPTNAPPSDDDSSSGGDDSSGGGDGIAGDAGTTTDDPPIDTTTSGIEPADTGGVDLDEDTTDGGCACAADRRSIPALPGFFALVLFVLRRRR
jgi:hypothetical protein